MKIIGRLRQQIPSARSLRSSAGPLAPATKAAGIGLFLATLLVLLGTAAAHTTTALKASKHSAVYIVTATAYEAVAGQTDSQPFLTADNSRIPRGYGSHTRWLALSHDLLQPWGGPFAFGDKVQVEGLSPTLDGVYTIHDTMHPRFRHRLDVLAHPREHLNLAQPGVKLRRVAAAHQPSRRRGRPAAQAHQKTAAHRASQPHQQPASLRTTRPRPAVKRAAAVARPPGIAKKRLATRPGRRVAAQAKSRHPARRP